MAITKREAEDFLKSYNPSRQADVVANRIAFSDDFSPLVAISHAYGYNISTAWVLLQISDLNEFCGTKTKMSAEKQRELATIIINKYGYLTTGELMLFFYNCKAGEYGEFYGVVDPILLGVMLKKFLEQRNAVKERQERERWAREAEQSRQKYQEDLARARSKGYKSVLEMSIAEGRYSKEQIEMAKKIGIGGMDET